LTTLYGTESGMDVRRMDGGGMQVSLVLPLAVNV